VLYVDRTQKRRNAWAEINEFLIDSAAH